MVKYQEKELECIHCGKGFKLDEIFIAHLNNNDKVTISCHLDCGKSSTKKEREGGWIVIQRTLQGYEVKSDNSKEV